MGVELNDDESALAATAIRHRLGELCYRARINPVDASVMGTDTKALEAIIARLEG